MRGAAVCGVHGGRAPQVRARALVRAEVSSWGLTDEHVDPGETLLRLVSQSARRANLYAGLLERAYDAAGRLHAAVADGHDPGAEGDAEMPNPAGNALRDLEQILDTGGVGVLIGKTWASAGADGLIYASGEAVRALARLEAEERDRCANFAAKAVAAGLAERQVRLAEQQAAVWPASSTRPCGQRASTRAASSSEQSSTASSWR